MAAIPHPKGPAGSVPSLLTLQGSFPLSRVTSSICLSFQALYTVTPDMPMDMSQGLLRAPHTGAAQDK